MVERREVSRGLIPPMERCRSSHAERNARRSRGAELGRRPASDTGWVGLSGYAALTALGKRAERVVVPTPLLGE